MIKGLFTKPKLNKKKKEDENEDSKNEGNSTSLPRVEENDRRDRVLNLTGDVKDSASN